MSEEQEVSISTPKPNRVADYMETSFDFPTGFVDEAIEPEKELKLNTAQIREIAKTTNKCRILKFLHDNAGSWNANQICTGLHGMPGCTFHHHKKPLLEIGIIQLISGAPVSKQEYYTITNRKEVERVLKRYFFLCGFKLARFLSLTETITADELKQDFEFTIFCSKHQLTLDEGLECLRMCTRYVEVIKKPGYGYGEYIESFKRKKQ